MKMKQPRVLHVILNSHLDPVWLWSRAQGEDAAIATARTTCDLLDEYPEIHATRGEAWFYETVERFDPALPPHAPPCHGRHPDAFFDAVRASKGFRPLPSDISQCRGKNDFVRPNGCCAG